MTVYNIMRKPRVIPQSAVGINIEWHSLIYVYITTLGVVDMDNYMTNTNYSKI